MSPPRRLCIFPGCHSMQGNGSVSLFKFPSDDNLGKRCIDFVKRSYCGEFKVTTNTRLCSVHFTPDSYSNCHQVKSGYLKSPLTLVSGAEPTLSVPGLHPPIPPTASATIMATGIMCPPPACIFLSHRQHRQQVPPSRPRHYMSATTCILSSRQQRVPPSQTPALCARHQLVSSHPADSGCHHHGHRHYVPATDPLHPADNWCSHLRHRH